VSATKVKICGLTRLRDAELAVSLGAWALGMIFYEPSPRRCSVPQAQAICQALRRKVELVGVFVNEPLPRIVELAELLQLSIVQLHGDEGPSFCAEVARRTGAKVCKVAQVSTAGDLKDIERFHVDYHLLDAKGDRGLRGGTGSTFDWSLLSSRRCSVPLILSGGLNPQNVAEAIERVMPFAVDVASGVEQAPGLKDEAKMQAFFDAVTATGTKVAA
jgi:phosphoribosylanthranilate isomerase